ncbi:MAG: AraC family transcriptional regulator [Alphaproteobacteria bacterium]|nr:AraC family transcriptional regulator [Alphaproteobacteria bacterium]
MHFAAHTPEAPLDSYIQSIFHFKGFQPDHSIERVVPDGGIYLIFELDGFKRHIFDNETHKPIHDFTRVWLAGMHKNYIAISAHEDSEMFVVQFHPGGAHPFLSVPVCDLNDRVVPAEQLFGDSIFALRESLLSANSDEAMFAYATEYLMDHATFDDGRARKLVEQMVAAIKDNAGALLQEIVETSGYSQKQAIHHFKAHVGLNPKAFQRVVRFGEILAAIKEKKTVSWSQIAADCVYYDQSHFIREFKAFCGYSPRDFLEEQDAHPEVNFFPLD